MLVRRVNILAIDSDCVGRSNIPPGCKRGHSIFNAGTSKADEHFASSRRRGDRETCQYKRYLGGIFGQGDLLICGSLARSMSKSDGRIHGNFLNIQ